MKPMPTYRIYEREDLAGVVELCRAEGWPSFPADPQRAHRAMTAPGVTTVVAVDGSCVVGFACLQSDGEIQSHLSLIAVDTSARRQGIARRLVAEALAQGGGERIDLVTDSAEEFYAALPHRRLSGFRLYPPADPDTPTAATAPRVRPLPEGERDWMSEVIRQRWAGPVVVSRGKAHDATRLSAMVADLDGERLGLATYRVEGGDAELVTLDALVQGQGIGTALLEAVTEVAARKGCRRLWLITTNDNLDSIRFYQRRGLRLTAVHPGAVDEARRIKPQIPVVGDHGIDVHDEVEFEFILPPSRSLGRT
jgi:ribosomal protein S18 acetylase RimI-like enzyme